MRYDTIPPGGINVTRAMSTADCSGQSSAPHNNGATQEPSPGVGGLD